MNEEKDSSGPHRRFASPWHLSDVVLDVQGRKFYVHRCILSMNSVFFETMFTSDFKEKSGAEICLPGKSAKEIGVLLNMVYSENKELILTYDNIEFLLKLADEYQMDKIKKICIDFMASNINEYPDNCLYFCQIADQCCLTEDEFIKKCLEKAKWLPLPIIKNSKHFAQLSSKLTIQLLLEKIKVLEKNSEVLQEHYSTCSDLVGVLYQSASKCSEKFKQFRCKSSHHSNEPVSSFVLDCKECLSKLEKSWPTSKPYKAIETSIKRLRYLETYFKLAADPRL